MFHKAMPNNEKKINLKNGQRPYVEFETYGHTTKINMQEKAIVGFSACSFVDYLDLFKAVNLTNRIKDIFKDKP